MAGARPSIRRLEAAERDVAVDVLSAAFVDYPVMRFVLGLDPRTDPDGLAALVGFFTDVRYDMGWPVLGLEVEGEVVAASLVNEPTDEAFLERFADGLARLREALGEEAYARLVAFERASEGNEPPERHWFVGMVGVRPGHQRMGYGRKLLQHVHDLAAADGCGVALSTEDPRNLPFYEALGYRVLAETAVGDFRTWGFWRPAG